MSSLLSRDDYCSIRMKMIMGDGSIFSVVRPTDDQIRLNSSHCTERPFNMAGGTAMAGTAGHGCTIIQSCWFFFGFVCICNLKMTYKLAHGIA